MEPVFLAAEADAIPELRRFVVSDGRRVAMEETLDEAIHALAAISGDARPNLEAVAGVSIDLPAVDIGQWPAEGLTLLEDAETALRAGGYEGFGSSLEQLRALLERLAAQGGG